MGEQVAVCPWGDDPKHSSDSSVIPDAEKAQPHGSSDSPVDGPTGLPVQAEASEAGTALGAFTSPTRAGSSLGRWELVEARAQGTPAEVHPASRFSCPSAPSSPSARTSAITPGLRAQASKTRPREEGRLVSQAGPLANPRQVPRKSNLELEQCFPGHPVRTCPSDLPGELSGLATRDCPQPGTPRSDKAIYV